MKRNTLNTPRTQEIKNKKNKILRRKILFFAFLFLLVLVGLSFLSKWEKININKIQISGNKVIDTETIENIARDKIAGYYLWFFPKSNSFIFPKGEIERELTGSFNRIKDITLSIKNLRTLDISLNERDALYTYCGVSIGTEDKCYFMDESGYIFDEAPYFSGGIYFKFYGSITNPGEPSGSYFFQPIFGDLVSFKKAAEKMGVKPVAFLIEESGDIKMLLQPSSSQTGPEIIFKSDSDFAKVAENLQSVLTTEPMQSDFKKKYSSLLYIDLRFGNKVYYKFK